MELNNHFIFSKINTKHVFALLLFLIISFSSFSGTVNNTQLNADSLETLLITLEDTSEEAIKIKITLANYYGDIKLPKSMKYTMNLEKIEALLTENQRGSLYLLQGKNYFQLSNHSRAIDKLMESLTIAKKTNNLTLEADVANNLGVVYLSINQTQKSIEFINRAIEISKNNNDKGRAVTLSSNLSLMYASAGDFDLAFNYINAAIKLNDNEVKSIEKKVSNFNTLAYLYIFQGNTTEALLSCNQALETSNKNNIKNISLRATTQAILCEVYSTLKNYEKVLTHGKKLIELAEILDSKLQLKLAYEYLAKAYEGQGNIVKSYDYYKKFSLYKDSVLTEDKYRHIKEIEVKYDIEQIELENTLLVNENKIYQQEQEIESQKKMVLTIGFGFLLILIIGLLYYFKNREKKHKLENELAKSELKHAEQEITDLALHLIQKDNAYDFIKKELKSINKQEIIPEGKKVIQNLIQDINLNLGLDQDRLLFKEKIEKQETKFINQLKKTYPNFTKKDVDLALLIRLKFASKEIASIFKISHQSVNTSRYRLRKKMELTQQQDLIEVIKNI